jgi:hypothetical protein
MPELALLIGGFVAAGALLFLMGYAIWNACR